MGFPGWHSSLIFGSVASAAFTIHSSFNFIIQYKEMYTHRSDCMVVLLYYLYYG